MSYTLLHPASFANNLFYKAESVAVEHILPAAAPTGRVAYIDIRDLSEAAALVLRDPTLHGKTYDLSGPDAYTFPEIAELPSMILGHEIKYVRYHRMTVVRRCSRTNLAMVRRTPPQPGNQR